MSKPKIEYSAYSNKVFRAPKARPKRQTATKGGGGKLHRNKATALKRLL